MKIYILNHVFLVYAPFKILFRKCQDGKQAYENPDLKNRNIITCLANSL